MSEFSKEKQILDRIAKDAKEYWALENVWGNNADHHYKEGAIKEAARSQLLLEALEKLTVDHYPESIFQPLTDEEWKGIKWLFEQAGFSLDRLSAEIARKIKAPIIKAATEAINNYKK